MSKETKKEEKPDPYAAYKRLIKVEPTKEEQKQPQPTK